VDVAAFEKKIACAGCGALVPDVPGPTHRYVCASPGCWAIYCEVLACEYADSRYGWVHRLTVDAYSAQHPGTPSPQSIQSVAVHLIGLHLVLERGYSTDQAREAVRRATAEKGAFRWLEPPGSLGSVTVMDVYRARDPAEHMGWVERWAGSVWESWAPHHATVRRWAEV
jgi:hypothetical protein